LTCWLHSVSSPVINGYSENSTSTTDLTASTTKHKDPLKQGLIKKYIGKSNSTKFIRNINIEIKKNMDFNNLP
jgi:hypothetical protein